MIVEPFVTPWGDTKDDLTNLAEQLATASSLVRQLLIGGRRPDWETQLRALDAVVSVIGGVVSDLAHHERVALVRE